MKRPSRTIQQIPKPAELAALAAQASYVGSREHKEKSSWLGLPHARRAKKGSDQTDHRQNATICPLTSDDERLMATKWVQEAIKRGQFNPADWHGDFPSQIWYKDSEGQYWFGRLTSGISGASAPGSYKGWPIPEDEWRENFDPISGAGEQHGSRRSGNSRADSDHDQ